jgi:hypothetical protein
VSTLVWVPRSNIWSKRHDSDSKKGSYLDLAKSVNLSLQVVLFSLPAL